MGIFLFRKKYLVFLFLVGGVIALNAAPDAPRALFYKASAPIQAALWDGGGIVSDALFPFKEGQALREENERLKKENILLRSEVVQLDELKEENRYLRAALNLGIVEDYSVREVQILGKEVESDTLLVRFDSEQNDVRVGMPVITPEKMAVGKVINVQEGFARVRLLTHEESSIDAEVEEKNITAIVEGQGRLQMIFRLVPQDAALEQGDLVTTSSLGGVFPEGMIIGEIKEFHQSDVETYQSATIEPAILFAESEFLLVITSY